MKRKVCVVVTARPSYSRVKTALQAIKNHPKLELQLVVAASALLDRYGSAVEYIEKDGFEIASRVFNVLEGESPTTMAKTTGLGILELGTVFNNLQPDVVVTIADRYETLATAVAASYMNIPVAHIQGGEVSGSIDEKVRHAVTKLSDLHFVSTKKSYERVIKMGENPSNVFITGCPSVDVALEAIKKPVSTKDLFSKYGGVGPYLNLLTGYIVVMQHPVTTEYELARKQITETLYAAHEVELPIIWFWPNVDAGSDGTSNGIRSFRENERLKTKQTHFFKNMEPDDFIRLIYRSKCLVGNSSVGIRESAVLGVPVVNIGGRQRGRERGKNIIDVDYDRKSIKEAILKQKNHKFFAQNNLYGSGDSGKKIAKLLAESKLTIDKKLSY